ncbi:MAG TPA: peptidase M48 family protein, partial [Sphingorhabdus lacus]|nr:peptidase M48 family protein [Sphingorhabdus lacus]
MKSIAFCAVLGLATIATAASNPSDVKAYQALVQQDIRIATIGYKLAAANAPFCKKLERNPGWVLQDERQY